MKKLIAFLTVAGMLTFGVTSFVMAQDEAAAQTEQTADTTVQEEAAAPQETLVAEDEAP
ncbi:MAG TPA: flagellar motor protein MotA, partial [Bacteroidales bacterium]|nr:flagellar motor protein MotA [Bacteroidales bacterium]